MAEEILPGEDDDIGDYIGATPEPTPIPSAPEPQATADFSEKWVPGQSQRETVPDDDSDIADWIPNLFGDKVSDQTLSDQITGKHSLAPAEDDDSDIGDYIGPSLLDSAIAEREPTPEPTSSSWLRQGLLDLNRDPYTPGKPYVDDERSNASLALRALFNDPKSKALDVIAGDTIPKKLGFLAGMAINPGSPILSGLSNAAIQAGARYLDDEKVLDPWQITKDFAVPAALTTAGRFLEAVTRKGPDPILQRMDDSGMARPVEMPVSHVPNIPPLASDRAAYDKVQEVKEAGRGIYPMARRARAYMTNSPSKYLQELAQRFAALDSTSGGLAQSSKAAFLNILKEEGLTPNEIQRTLFDWMKSQMQGHVGGAWPPPSAGYSPNVQRAAQRIRDEVFEPFAQRMDAGGMMTKIKDELTGVESLIPFKRLRGFVPEYSKQTPFSVRALARNAGRRVYAPWMHRKTGPVPEVETNALAWGTRYIDELSRKVGQLETLGPERVLDPDMPGGDYVRHLLTQAINEGKDPVGVSLALKAVRDIYEPATMESNWKTLLGTSGQILLGQNPFTQGAQVAMNVAHNKLGNTAEHMGRWINSPEYRHLHMESGAMEPGWMQSVTQGFGVTPESKLGKGIKFVDQTINRGFTSGVTPRIEEVEKAAMMGKWLPWMDKWADEAGVTKQQLERGLSQGQLQAAQAHLVQREQLLPGGAGQGLSGFSGHPVAKGMAPWLEFQASQAGLAIEDMLKPTWQGLKPLLTKGDTSQLSLAGLGAGRIARGLGTAAALEAVLRPAADVAAGRGIPDPEKWRNEVLGRTTTDVFGALGVPVDEWINSGSPGGGQLVSSPAMSTLYDLGHPFDKSGFAWEKLPDYAILANQVTNDRIPGLGYLPYFRNMIRNSIKGARSGDSP